MFYGAPQKSCKASPFRSWFVLPQEHEQENQNLHHLLVAQADLYCQFQHGNSLVYAGSAANWLTVGYLLHAVAWRGSWLTANGLDRRLWLAMGSSLGLKRPCLPHLKPCSCTAAWVTSPSSLPRTRLCVGDILKESI